MGFFAQSHRLNARIDTVQLSIEIRKHE